MFPDLPRQMAEAATIRDRDILARHLRNPDGRCADTHCQQSWPCDTRLEAAERLRLPGWPS